MNTPKQTILVVDDDTAHRSMLCTLLRGWGYATEEADDGDVAVTRVHAHAFDAILCDVRMVRMDGLSALALIQDYNPSIPVLLMTAYSSVESAIEALRNGAYDYMLKPLDFDLLQRTLERALEHARLSIENRELRRQLGEKPNWGIVGRSKPILDLVQLVETVAPTEATVLITGESGTGKEMVARALHEASRRSQQPLITVNCAALAESLLESELFGHEKGAFTGADRRREGRFMQANGGTLFLDEIGDMPLALQVKLLRALQQKEIQRVGGNETLLVDARLVAATNRDLSQDVSTGHFREDLFYRLNVIAIHVPPLRARQEDIPLLASFFLNRFAEKNRKSIKGFTPQAMDCLLKHDWPGNIRELENAVERAVILGVGEYVTERELPLTMQHEPVPAESITPDTAENNDMNNASNEMYANLSLEDVERRAILATLKETNDNKSETARRLGITRATLHSKLRRYEVE